MFSRRQFLSSTACGFGSLATATLLSEWSTRSALASGSSVPSGLHIPAKAKRVIFLFMQGGVSQVDSFDYKPILEKRDGEMLDFVDAREFANSGKAGSKQRILKSPWKFKPYGESGHLASELFPKTSEHMDKLTQIRSMHTEGIAHGPATLFLHCGSHNFVRPSVGSWVQYGIGSENENLPGFISIAPSTGNGGQRNYGNAFLPAKHQGTPIGNAGNDQLAIQFLQPQSGKENRDRLERLQALNQLQIARRDTIDSELEAAIGSYEMAWRMQSTAPDLIDFSNESAETQELYGLNRKETKSYGSKCLLARRLCEAGVRFVQVNYGDNSANPAWDQHSNLPKHAEHALAVDQPISGLLTDLERRGLLQDTLVWWGGEFGRAPYAEKNGTGRDHNPGGFTMWLAGAGVKPGLAFGATDEFGHHAIENKVHMHDLHATILHLLGIDHEKLTYRHAGRDFRLTDVYGRVVKGILQA
jgi:hypothetical protein